MKGNAMDDASTGRNDMKTLADGVSGLVSAIGNVSPADVPYTADVVSACVAAGIISRACGMCRGIEPCDAASALDVANRHAQVLLQACLSMSGNGFDGKTSTATGIEGMAMMLDDDASIAYHALIGSMSAEGDDDDRREVLSEAAFLIDSAAPLLSLILDRRHI